MRVAILGAGNGGASAAVELGQRGFDTALWNRSAVTLAPFQEAGGIKYSGVFGEGKITPALISTDLVAAVDGADVILVCVPTLAHAEVATALVDLGANHIPVVLNPGHTGGALEFVEVFRRHGLEPPATAEFSTLTYVARKPQPNSIRITGAAKHVWVAALPGGDPAIDAARQLFPVAEEAEDVLASGLANVNMVLHPPGAILAAAWIESRVGDFTFYVEGLPDGVGRIMQALDEERLQVAAAFGHKLPDLFQEMQAIGTIEPDADPAAGLATAIRAGKANREILAPDSLQHRYYREDFWYGILPFLAIADIAKLKVPVARSLMNLARVLVGEPVISEGRSAKAMGVAGFSIKQLQARVAAA